MWFILFLVIIALLVVRWLGEKSLTVEPQSTPALTINQQTPLYQATNAQLQRQAEPKENLFYPLSNPHVALLTRLKLADSATDTIDVQYYLFHDDDSGQALLLALAEAAKRGVKVRLLLDDMDTLKREGIFIRLLQEHPSMEMRIFNPFYLRFVRLPEYLARFPRVTRRMHNKSYTIDGITTIVGGRNIGNEYFNFKTEVAFADFDLLVAGKVASDVTVGFNDYWYSGLAYDINQLGKPASDADYQAWLTQAQAALAGYRSEVDRQQEAITSLLANSANLTYYADMQVIYDRPQKVISKFSDTSGNITGEIAKLMQSAQKELVISSPYFIPGKFGLELFKSLRDRGVEVIILTNSYAANDVPAVHAGYMNYRKQLLEMGVQLYELTPQNAEAQLDRGFELLGSKRASLHAKAFVVDRHLTFVGSFNLDPRSAVHNTEMGVVFSEPNYGNDSVENSQRYMQAQAYKVVMNDKGEIEWHQQVNGELTIHQQEPDMTTLDKVITTVISWLPVEWLM